MWDLRSFYPFILKNCDECKIQIMNNGFNNIQSEWFNSCANVNISKYAKTFTNVIKYKCEASNCCVCFNNVICNVLNNDFNKFKMDDSTHEICLQFKKCEKNHLTIQV